ncbi:uncharacterized protein LOC103353180 isoform X3 [Stegastes partitus]|uniref:Uncharacterized protein LOC103353180 isoform X3 n=1 Tax=Stegastes partitus TaxID=144197 RepID=A0A9Y4MTI8_9TELE|nr:PREDICTED: uncharacterized protein LOC103353180 isoform X3 [Stegastes partitus]
MDGLYVLLLFFSGIVSCSHHLFSGSVLEVTARPGDNITVCCDCKISKGVYIVWFRNCSHENQPTLVLKLNDRKLWESTENQKSDSKPRFELMKSLSSDSWDLLIKNITNADEGLYYCGTEEMKMENKDHITDVYIHRYSNMTTRITVNSTGPHQEIQENCKTEQNCDVCWKLLFSLCPAVAVLSSLFSLLVYKLCQKTATKHQDDEKRHESRSQGKQDDDVCYAALDIRQPSQRPKRKQTQSSDFSTYSAIKTSRV